ncbi:hypothetical protein GDO81_009963 [Engystomops pustulosus]|uniref:Secreted protein n=1 Tax=Engystomops pustulosus TaxID=76066 RepID=A0AAV7BVR4_ENGPU|nr:hypothetical protein GDO81_009963 [Engystomops pustulosus]
MLASLLLVQSVPCMAPSTKLERSALRYINLVVEVLTGPMTLESNTHLPLNLETQDVMVFYFQPPKYCQQHRRPGWD